MTADSPAHPAATETWVASIHASEHDFTPLGSAVLIEPDRVLTCAHCIVADDGGVKAPLWVAFPKAAGCPRRRVCSSEVRYEPPVWNQAIEDLAVLVLSEPVPAGVEPAPLRRPADDVLG